MGLSITSSILLTMNAYTSAQYAKYILTLEKGCSREKSSDSEQSDHLQKNANGSKTTKEKSCPFMFRIVEDESDNDPDYFIRERSIPTEILFRPRVRVDTTVVDILNYAESRINWESKSNDKIELSILSELLYSSLVLVVMDDKSLKLSVVELLVESIVDDLRHDRNIETVQWKDIEVLLAAVLICISPHEQLFELV